MPFRRGRRRRRERYEWTFGGFSTPRVVAVGQLDNFTLVPQAGLEEWARPLWVRTIGSLFVSPSTAPAAASGYGVFVGLAKRSTTPTSTQLWDPRLNPDHRWQWWNVCFPQIGGTGAADQNAARWAGYFRFDVNMRMRERMADDEEIAVCVSNDGVSAASIQYSCFFRFLLATGAK